MEVKDKNFEKFYEKFLKGLKRKHPINLHDALWYGFDAGFNSACEQLYELDYDTEDVGNYRDLAWPEEEKLEYESGFEDGYDEGYDEGNEDSYDEGYEDGYSNGFEDGQKELKSENCDEDNEIILNKDTLYEALKHIFCVEE